MKYRIVMIKDGFSTIYKVQEKHLFIWCKYFHDFESFKEAEEFVERLKVPRFKQYYYKSVNKKNESNI